MTDIGRIADVERSAINRRQNCSAEIAADDLTSIGKPTNCKICPRRQSG